ncbi:hypothetical protein [Azospirillum soli]|uniref:hypothetical protein n=1 Tax=Azospirillum soli TaxID=1304799 RepID=UPI001AE80642|nr:hypothetical protein [Azospirillum soli]MBP2311869.1 hypothetical protein [Azospirillum soli]
MGLGNTPFSTQRLTVLGLVSKNSATDDSDKYSGTGSALLQPHTGAAPIFGDKLHPGFLQRLLDSGKIFARCSWDAVGRLHAPDRGQPDPTLLRKVVCGPANQGATSTDLV